MENKFFLQNSIEKIENERSSFFLDPKEKEFVISRLRKKNIPYQIYSPYEEAEKVLVYNGEFPEIELLEIVSKKTLEHRAILGTLFAHQILPHFYSDIMITENTHYLIVLKSIATYLKNHVREIGKVPVEFVQRDILQLEEYRPSYENFLLHVSGLRLDMIVSKITKQSRKKVDEIIQNREVFLNYIVATKKDMILKEGDIFSIRGYGKYCFDSIRYQNRKGNMDIEILRYK